MFPFHLLKKNEQIYRYEFVLGSFIKTMTFPVCLVENKFCSFVLLNVANMVENSSELGSNWVTRTCGPVAKLVSNIIMHYPHWVPHAIVKPNK